MTQTRLLVALVVLIAAATLGWLTPPRPGITEANCGRLKPGMRLHEAEAILGGPPGEYQHGRLVRSHAVNTPVNWLSSAEWNDEEGYVVVTFRENGTVAWARYGRYAVPKPTPFRRRA